MPIYLKQGKYKEALEEILHNLEPGLCEDCGCLGCKHEVSDAINLAKAVLGHPVHRERCPHCQALDKIWKHGPGHPDGPSGWICHACGKELEEDDRGLAKSEWIYAPADV